MRSFWSLRGRLFLQCTHLELIRSTDSKSVRAAIINHVVRAKNHGRIMRAQLLYCPVSLVSLKYEHHS